MVNFGLRFSLLGKKQVDLGLEKWIVGWSFEVSCIYFSSSYKAVSHSNSLEHGLGFISLFVCKESLSHQVKSLKFKLMNMESGHMKYG